MGAMCRRCGGDDNQAAISMHGKEGHSPFPGSYACSPERLYAGGGGCSIPREYEPMKFHESSCRYYDCPHCTAVFRTREAAIDAGYVPCRVCNP